MTSSGTPVLDALESFYSDSIESLAHQLAIQLARLHQRDALLETMLDELRCADFLSLYLDQIQSVPVDEWITGLDLRRGTLRASIVGRELATNASGRRRSMIIDGDHLGSDHLPLAGLPPAQVKAAMCYAHDLVIEDPFDEEQVLADFIASVTEEMPHVPMRVAPDPEHFVETVAALASLAPAVRARHVTFVPRRLAMDSAMVGRFASNAWDAFGKRSEELARRSLRLWLSSGGVVTPLFGDAAEELAFVKESGLLEPLVKSRETVRLHQIASLTLPTAGDLGIAQMVAVRQDDAFEEFRARQRVALSVVGSGTNSEDRAAYREEMAQAARELQRSLESRRSLRSWMAGAIGWSVGASVVAPESWQAAVAAIGGVTTQTVAKHVLERPRDSLRALHHHYATLGSH